ncbi:MAG: S41 family peptidase, partial [Acidobacteriota bacterium]
GNTDVYVVPVTGGVPQRLTWYPGADWARDWTRDGSAVLFVSGRESHTTRHGELFTVAVDGGMPERLPIPNAWWASISPDGDRIAYTPIADRHLQWKNYRGGTQARIWIYDRSDHSILEVPKPEGGSNDTRPVWLGEEVWFLSDRDGEFNLYSFDPGDPEGGVQRHTFHDDFPILSHGTNGEAIIYEQAGWLHRWEPGMGRTGERLPVGVAADLIERRPRWIRDEPQWIRDAHVSPSGARAVFEFRGEIVTVPAEHGDPRNLTQSVDAHDRSPAWSPDGSRIAFFSDAGGEYRLHLIDQRGEGPERVIPVEGHGFYEEIVFSPDGDKILYTDNSMALYLLDLQTERAVEIAKEPYYGPFKTISGSFSPDGEWVAYTVPNDADFRQVWLYRIADGARFPVTDGLSDAFSPVFDASGEHLYLLASTDAGPLRGWFAMSNADAEATSSIYVAVLAEGAESPLKARSDEEPLKEPDEDDGDDRRPDGDGPEVDGSDEAGPAEAGPDDLTYDLDDIDQRIVALPLPPADYSYLQAGEDNQLYYLRRDPGNGFGEFAFGPASLRMYDLDAREEKSLADGALGFALSADDSKMLVAMPDDTWIIAPAGQPVDPSKGRLAVGEIEVKIDPVAEWRQIYREAWRINRDYFYDPNFHGADWEAMGEKYSEFLGHLATRDDLNRVIRWMASELAVGHSYLGGGDTLVEAEEIPGGLLGADFEVADGRYRLAKIYGGLNWNPDLRSPLTEPGVDAREGEYLLAVEGEELRPPDNVHARFENTAGEQVQITLGPSADGTDSRTVTVVPVESESGLRNRDWVEGNIDKVTAATDGRVAYVYVPNTAGLGHTYFKRYFFPQANRDAIIVDERYNGGGQVADYYIDILRRPYISHWATRYGRDYKTPFYSIQGPKVMIIDETAGSGGDLLPWMFRKLELGPLVGKRTWGGLVGILGFPTLMDGGSITAPNLAIWTEDGFVVENVGVPPDHEVEQLPADVIAGRDPQLERAIELALQMLEENPPPDHTKPEYPIRVRQQ